MEETANYKKLMKYQREHPNMSEGPEDVAPVQIPDNAKPENDKEVDHGRECE